MYRNGPGQLKRVLGKSADQLFLYFTRNLIGGIPDVLPFVFFYDDLLVVAFCLHFNDISLQRCNSSNLAIKKSLFPGRVVLDEHNLRPFLQLQNMLGRVGVFTEFIFHSCPVKVRRGFQFFQLLFI
ncbi:hypothetical protein D3C86_1793750 [compost metagenome]